MNQTHNPDPPPAPAPPPVHDVPLSQKTSQLAIWAVILGVPGLCIAPLGIAALVMGIVALVQIANPARALTGRGLATTGVVLGGSSIIVVPFLALMLGILLPALGAARRAARQMQNTTQVRGIMQGTITYSNNNNDYYPGLDPNGNPVDLTVEGRFAEMLDQNVFGGAYLISPSETKVVWQGGAVTTANYSYALLDVSDLGGRRNEWRVTINAMAIAVSDRNTGASPASSDVMSIHTSFPGDWQGSVARNDGSASFENFHELDVQYGRGPMYQYDNIFEMTASDDAAMIESGE